MRQSQWDYDDLEWYCKTFKYHIIEKQNVRFSVTTDLIRLKSEISEMRQSFISIRNYYSRQRNHRKNLCSPFVSKFNLRVIKIFGREFLNYENRRKTLSKLQRPETGRASAWELRTVFLTCPNLGLLSLKFEIVLVALNTKITREIDRRCI